jgi:hypothetical protein
MPFNSEGMLRGAMDSRGLCVTGLLAEQGLTQAAK